MTYTAIIERADDNYSAFVPDLPGCIATGATIEEVKAKLRKAVTWHIQALREENMPIPPPSSTATLVEV